MSRTLPCIPKIYCPDGEDIYGQVYVSSSDSSGDESDDGYSEGYVSDEAEPRVVRSLNDVPVDPNDENVDPENSTAENKSPNEISVSPNKSSQPLEQSSGSPKAKGSDSPKAKGSDSPKAKGSDSPKAKGSDSPKAKGSDSPKAKGYDSPKASSPIKKEILSQLSKPNSSRKRITVNKIKRMRKKRKIWHFPKNHPSRKNFLKRKLSSSENEPVAKKKPKQTCSALSPEKESDLSAASSKEHNNTPNMEDSDADSINLNKDEPSCKDISEEMMYNQPSTSKMISYSNKSLLHEEAAAMPTKKMSRKRSRKCFKRNRYRPREINDLNNISADDECGEFEPKRKFYNAAVLRSKLFSSSQNEPKNSDNSLLEDASSTAAEGFSNDGSNISGEKAGNDQCDQKDCGKDLDYLEKITALKELLREILPSPPKKHTKKRKVLRKRRKKLISEENSSDLYSGGSFTNPGTESDHRKEKNSDYNSTKPSEKGKPWTGKRKRKKYMPKRKRIKYNKKREKWLRWKYRIKWRFLSKDIGKARKRDRRRILKNYFKKFSKRENPWRERVLTWIQTILRDLVIPEDEQPTISLAGMSADDYFYVDNVDSNLDFAAEMSISNEEEIEVIHVTSSDDKSSVNQSSDDKSSVNQSSDDKSSVNQSSDDKSSVTQSSDIKSVAQSSDNKSSGSPSSDDQSSDKFSSKNQSSDDRLSDKLSTKTQPSDDQSSDNTSDYLSSDT